MNEESQERLKKKKELKKEAKKHRLESESCKVVEVNDLKVSGTKTEVKSEENEVVEKKERDLETVKEEKSDLNMNNQSRICLNPSQKNHDTAESNENKFENIELEEKEEGFIGPRLPRLMAKEEVEALFKELFPNSDRYK